MKKRTHWAWKIYFSLFSIGALLNLVLLLSGESSASQYYKILTAFRHGYILYGYLHALDVIVNVLSLIPFFLFVFRIRLFPPLIWQALFLVRIFFFFTGHSYEVQALRSLAHNDSLTIIAVGILFILFTLPSYIACFAYAFRREKLFS